MKKRILIISHAMEIGGAERALLGLLESFDYSKYDVDLFLGRHEGDLFDLIPESVNVLPTNQAKYLAVPMSKLVKDLQFGMLFGRLKAKLLSRQKVKKLNLKKENNIGLTYSHWYTYKYINFINSDVNYDLAISFLTPHYICLNKCNAKKKIAWIHTDYSMIDIDIKTELNMWKKFDYIASISDKCTESFLNKFPTLANKIVRIDNILTKSMIKSQINDEEIVEMQTNSIKLLSVGRFCYAKNFDNIPEICSLILKQGLEVKWYIIGYGGDEQLIKDKIKEFNMDDYVIILGKKENPYPYINNCDIYVQPSRYEGKAVTVREAQLLEKPVVITNFPTAQSQLQDGIDGVIIPLENKLCANELVKFIKDVNIQQTLSKYLQNNDYSNLEEVNKIYELLS